MSEFLAENQRCEGPSTAIRSKYNNGGAQLTVTVANADNKGATHEVTLLHTRDKINVFCS